MYRKRLIKNMVILFGQCISGRGSICVAALLRIWDGNGLYISHLRVSDQYFSRNAFGKNADSGTFLNRGIAKITVTLAQCYLRCLYGMDSIYLFSFNQDRSSGCQWDTLGFQSLNLIDNTNHLKFVI